MRIVPHAVSTIFDKARAGLPIKLFADEPMFEIWLAAQPPKSKGAWLIFGKKGSSLTSISKSEAVLCHGWIDGQQDRYDETCWLVRFTPRRTASRWSQINRTRALELIEAGRMTPTGREAIAAAQADGRWNAAYAPASTAKAPRELEIALEQTAGKSLKFQAISRTRRYAIIMRLNAVKRSETRSKIIADFIAALGD